MEGQLPPVPSIFDPDFGSKQPIGALLDALTVRKAQENRKRKDRARNREELELERCPQGEKLTRAMTVLEGAATDVMDGLADPNLTANDYRGMVEELANEVFRVARWSRKQ